MAVAIRIIAIIIAVIMMIIAATGRCRVPGCTVPSARLCVTVMPLQPLTASVAIAEGSGTSTARGIQQQEESCGLQRRQHLPGHGIFIVAVIMMITCGNNTCSRQSSCSTACAVAACGCTESGIAAAHRLSAACNRGRN